MASNANANGKPYLMSRTAHFCCSLHLQILALWRPVFVAELMVAAVVVPLQFASLAVVTLPLTLPWILDLQAAAPAAAAEGAGLWDNSMSIEYSSMVCQACTVSRVPFPLYCAGVRGMAAVKRSRHLLRPLRWQLAIPFVALLLTGRLLEAAKATLINALPARWVHFCLGVGLCTAGLDVQR